MPHFNVRDICSTAKISKIHNDNVSNCLTCCGRVLILLETEVGQVKEDAF
jgi:hypothetical protein